MEGLWIGDICDPQCECSTYFSESQGPTWHCIAFHRILPLQTIRQCVVLEDSGIILILAHNVRLLSSIRSSFPDMNLQDLCAYDLESCVPSWAGPKAYHPPQKLNGKSEVLFFRTGVIDGKARVVFSTRKRVRQWRTPRLALRLFAYIL